MISWHVGHRPRPPSGRWAEEDFLSLPVVAVHPRAGAEGDFIDRFLRERAGESFGGTSFVMWLAKCKLVKASGVRVLCESGNKRDKRTRGRRFL